MLIEIGMTTVVLMALFLGMKSAVGRAPEKLRSWYWLAFIEYLLCAGGQLLYSRVIREGGDTLYYARAGATLARFLSDSFNWSAGQMLSLLLQQESAFDGAVEGAGMNTGSMCALSGFLIFFLGGSQIAAHFLVAVLGLFGAIASFRAFQDAHPEAPPIPLFAATVLFPSVAFWTAAIHKETLCLIGIGLVLTAWRGIYHGRVGRSILYATLGLFLVFLFRTAVAPPLLLGLVLCIVLDRLKKSGPAALAFAPIYLALGIAVLAATMVLVSRISPKFGLDQIGDTLFLQRQGWHTQGSAGGSGIDGVEGGERGLSDKELRALGPQSVSQQMVNVPVALLNALLRPQLFDVRNFGTALSAIEMTIITLLIIRAIRRHRLGGVVRLIQHTPFLLMCTVIVVVGCAGVGLVTLNFGSLARYRTPFLPFYGALIIILAQDPASEEDDVAEPETGPARRARLLRRRFPRRRPVTTEEAP